MALRTCKDIGMTIANMGTQLIHVKVDSPYCDPTIKNPTYPTVTPWGIVEMTMKERLTGLSIAGKTAEDIRRTDQVKDIKEWPRISRT
jgi:hypothetical protein